MDRQYLADRSFEENYPVDKKYYTEDNGSITNPLDLVVVNTLPIGRRPTEGDKQKPHSGK